MNQARQTESRASLTLARVVQELPGSARIVGDASVRVSGVRHDSRTVEPGDLFVARKGTNADGARFVDDAIRRGAVAIMAVAGSIDAASAGVPVVFVDDPTAALALSAHAVYGRPASRLDVAGITGTNGKTTTAHLVRAAVDGAVGMPSCGVLGTIGNSFGAFHEPATHTTPEADDIARTLAKISGLGATHAAMEVSSHGLVLGRLAGVRFRAVALTNLTQDHLDFHGTMENYAQAKARLFTDFGAETAVINVDDPFGFDLAERLTGRVLRVSAESASTADVVARKARIDAAGINAAVRTPAGDVRIVSRLVGAHNLDNLLLALGIALALGLDLHRAAEALSREPGPPGRLERCDQACDGLTALVDYAHTPDALGRVLGALRPLTSGRLWCVFGAGGDRDPTKRAPMGEAVARGADVAVVTSDNPRSEDPAAIAASIVQGIRGAGFEPRVELDRRKAIELTIGGADPGDIVLVAGKGHEDYQQCGDVRLPFDDRIEVRGALQARRARLGDA